MQHFHPTSEGGRFSYGQAISMPKRNGPGSLTPFFAFLDSLGGKFLRNASIIPPKAGNGDVGRYVRECQGGKYAGKVVGTAAIQLDKLDDLESFATMQVGNGMLLAARSGKLFVIDPKL